jgi:hypothetical protein
MSWKAFGVMALLLVGVEGALAADARPEMRALPEMRMTPAEVRGSALGPSKIGSFGLVGAHTKVLFGSPERPGLYALLLFIPAHKTIQVHAHRDDRVAVVVLGEWQFGYGDHFDAQKLKALPPGSVYSEPGGRNHFARTGANAVVVELSGYGPTDTRYSEIASDPAAPRPTR